MLILQLLIFAISLIVLALTSHFAIKSIEQLIVLTGLSQASTGFVILAVMTSTPEIIVALFSVLQGTPAISVGDILGSNVFNMGAVLGILGMLGYLKTCCTDLLVELTDLLFITSMIPLLLVIFNYLPISGFLHFTPLIGLILLVTFSINTYQMLKKRTLMVEVNSAVTKKRGKKAPLAVFLLSFIGIIIAARLVVSSAINLVLLIAAPPILIGAKLVSISTSLPELTLDLTAARRGHVQLAIGDVIGSNLTNLTLVLGLVLISSPFAVDVTIFTEILPFLLITTVVFWRFLTRGGVSQIGGIILMMTYILFQAII